MMTMPNTPQMPRRRWVMLQRPGWNAATIGVIVMVVVHFASYAVFWWGGEESYESFYRKGALSWSGVSQGEGWQFFSYFWMHGSWSHLLINAVIFYYAAARLSHVLSSGRILLLFVLCSVGSGVVHVFAQLMFPGLPQGLLVGASGGVGLLLGYFLLSPDSRMFLLRISARNLGRGVLISSLLLFLVTPGLGVPVMAEFGLWLEQGFGSVIFQVAHLLHFWGGMMGALCIPYFFPRLLSLDDLMEMRAKREEVEIS